MRTDVTRKRSSRRLVALACLIVAACSTDPEVAKRQYLRSGDGYVAQKKFREAVVEYRNAIQQDPRYGEARLKLADSLFELGDLSNAYREYVRAADVLPDHVPAQMKAGQMLLLANRFDDAKVRADRVLALQPTHLEAQILRANALAGLNNIDQAIAQIDEAIRTSPDRSIGYASLGALRLAQGQRSAAEAAFKKAVATDSQSVHARLALAQFYLSGGRVDDAEANLMAALAIDNGNVMANRALAYFHIGEGRVAAAEPYLKAVAENAPAGTGKLVLADYYIATHRLEDARRTLDTIQAADGQSFTTAKLRLAALGLWTGDRITAARLIEEVLAQQPSHSEALVAKAQLLLYDKAPDQALVVLRSAAEGNPHSAQVQFALGKVLLAVRQPAEAITAFNEAVTLNPRLALAEIELARLHLAAGRLAEAEQFARSAIKKVPAFADAHLLVARIHLRRGQYDAAEKSLRALSAALPDSAIIQTEIGFLQLARRNRVAARDAFDKALALDSTYADALAAVARMDLQDKHPDAAKERVDAAVRKAPADVRLLLVASATYEASGDVAPAELLLRRALEIDPEHLPAYSALGRLYANQRRLKEATVEFEYVAKRQPRSVIAHTLVAMLLEMQNLVADAEARYERILEIDAHAAVAANNLAWIHAARGDNLDVALALAQTAKSRLPDSPEVNDTLGWIYYKKGLAHMAVPPLRESVLKDPNNSTYQYHLGMAYALNEDAEQARTALRKALALNSTFDGADDARETLAKLTR